MVVVVVLMISCQVCEWPNTGLVAAQAITSRAATAKVTPLPAACAAHCATLLNIG